MMRSKKMNTLVRCYSFLQEMSLMFSARQGCDHMLYDGACECIERPNEYDGDNFWLELAVALMEEPILLEEQMQAEKYLADECAENDADHARLEEYLAELALEDQEGDEGQEHDYVIEGVS